MTETSVVASRAAERRSGSRIVGVDLARGLALIGMAATHMLAVRAEETGHLTTVGWVAAGRASSLFAVLAGVSLCLVTGGQTPFRGRDRSRARVSIAVRAGLIGGIGLWLGGTGTPVAVILAYYAVLFVLSLPFLGLRPRTLAVLAVCWGLVSPVVSHLWRQHLGAGPNEQVSWGTVVDDPLAALRELVVLGYYPALTWMTYLLAGLAIGRLDLRATATAVRLLGVGAVTALGAWVTSVLLLSGGAADTLISSTDGDLGTTWWDLASWEGYGTTSPDSWAWLAVAAPHTGTPLDLIGTTGSAMAALGLCLLLVQVSWVRVLSHPVAAAGSMTLTLYTIHAVVLALPLGEWDSVAYYLSHVIVALTFATVWSHFVRRGPLEGMVHTISTAVSRAVVAPTAGSGAERV